jgi:hypothetical protein
MFAQLKLYAAYIVGAVILALAATACGEYLWIEHQKTTISTLKSQLVQAQDANATNKTTIDALTAERDKAGQTCQSRLNAKEDLIHKLQDIDAMSSAQSLTFNNGGPHEIGTTFSDPLLTALNSMYPAPDSKNGICQTAGTADSSGAAVLPGQVRYCFCSEQDIKNLLKNHELDKSDSRDLRSILNGMR